MVVEVIQTLRYTPVICVCSKYTKKPVGDTESQIIRMDMCVYILHIC